MGIIITIGYRQNPSEFKRNRLKSASQNVDNSSRQVITPNGDDTMLSLGLTYKGWLLVMVLVAWLLGDFDF
jgi:hypothetical protein